MWNMDETTFCLDPKKSQTIARKGSKAYKITQGGGRENVTIVGECESESVGPSNYKSRAKFPAVMPRR